MQLNQAKWRDRERGAEEVMERCGDKMGVAKGKVEIDDRGMGEKWKTEGGWWRVDGRVRT